MIARSYCDETLPKPIGQTIDLEAWTVDIDYFSIWGEETDNIKTVSDLNIFRAVNPPFLVGRLPVLEAVSLSPYFKRNPPVFGNNQFLIIKNILYENDMSKNSLFSFTNVLGSAWDLQVTDLKKVKGLTQLLFT